MLEAAGVAKHTRPSTETSGPAYQTFAARADMNIWRISATPGSRDLVAGKIPVTGGK